MKENGGDSTIVQGDSENIIPGKPITTRLAKKKLIT